jgi:TonB family protein
LFDIVKISIKGGPRCGTVAVRFVDNGEAAGRAAMRNWSLGVPLISSCLIHATLILVAAALTQKSTTIRPEFIPVGLMDLHAETLASVPEKAEKLSEVKKQPDLLPKAANQKEAEPMVPRATAKPEPHPLPLRTPERVEPIKVTETKPALAAKVETAPSFASGARSEGGVSAAGAGNLIDQSDVGGVPVAGTSGGGGGTAVSGLGRGSGAPGLPAPSVPIKTNREAKPIQTARASYPPMALRMGMEGDVTIKIIVDGEGKVTKAEIIKSGGAGFDEEALKAVKQSRFEPAQKDGQNMPAEFTYIYRFRLHR